MGRITFETNGYKYTVPKSDNEVQAILEQLINIKIEKTNGFTEGKINLTRDKIPKIQQIEEFIKSHSQYAHDKYKIAIHFLGTELKFKKGDKEYSAIYDILSKRILRARNRIAHKEKGIWKGKREGWGQPIAYIFVPKK